MYFPWNGRLDTWGPEITEEFYVDNYKNSQRDQIIWLLRRLRSDFGIDDKELNDVAVAPKTLDDLEFIRKRLLAFAQNRHQGG
jgi:hypothetical protein